MSTSTASPQKSSSQKTKSPSLSEQQLRAINYFDQVFHTFGSMPTPQKAALDLNLPVGKIKELLKDAAVVKNLHVRGVYTDLEGDEASRAHALLTSEQLIVANLILNVNDRRSIRQKLEDVGVSTRQFMSWQEQPEFSAYLRSRAEKLFANSDSQAFLALLNEVQSGDLNAIKLFFEMRGIYTPKVQVQIDIKAVIVQVVEVVQKHLAPLENGSDLLNMIAEDLGNLPALSGTSSVGDNQLSGVSGLGRGASPGLAALNPRASMGKPTPEDEPVVVEPVETPVLIKEKKDSESFNI